MQLSVINIGNSKGIRLSKTIIEKYSISDKVEIVFEKDYFILKAIEEPRKNWETAFKKMHQSGDDQPLINDIFEDENFEEWSK